MVGPASLLNRPDTDWLYAIGRLAPGANRARVEARVTADHRRWLAAQSFPTEEDRTQIGDVRVPVVSARGGVALLRYTYSQPLALLFAMSGLVLLIASANLANLLLARTDRQQIAVQAALGASSGEADTAVAHRGAPALDREERQAVSSSLRSRCGSSSLSRFRARATCPWMQRSAPPSSPSRSRWRS